MRARKTIHERAKADALHHSLDRDGIRLRHELFCVYYATPALPSDLNHFAVFNEQRHGKRRLRQSTQASASAGVAIDVVFNELAIFPFEPLAHLASVGAACGSVEFEVRHGPSPPALQKIESQQIRGKGSPTNMSTMRVPP